MDRPSFTFNSEVFRVASKLLFWLTAVYLLNVACYFTISKAYLRLSGGVSGAKISRAIRQRHDVFVFGASRGSHHHKPEILSTCTGLSVYNAADDGKSPTYQLGLLNLLLKQHKPEVIIYEVGNIIRSLDTGDVDLFPYYYSDAEVRHLLNKRDPFASIKFQFRAYAYNQKMLTGLKEILRYKTSAGDGYLPLYGHIDADEQIISREGLEGPDDSVNSGADAFMIENFQRFVSVCESNQIKVVFTFSPTLTGYHATCEKLIRSIASGKGIPFLDFSSDERFKGNRLLFKDVNHLNDEGAILFSKDLGEKLKVFFDSSADAQVIF